MLQIPPYCHTIIQGVPKVTMHFIFLFCLRYRSVRREDISIWQLSFVGFVSILHCPWFANTGEGLQNCHLARCFSPDGSSASVWEALQPSHCSSVLNNLCLSMLEWSNNFISFIPKWKNSFEMKSFSSVVRIVINSVACSLCVNVDLLTNCYIRM